MIGRKKKSNTPSEDSAVSGAATAVAEPPAQGTDATAPSDSAAAPQKDRFRSWVTDTAKGYERLTDEQARQIVLKFTGKPDAEVLSMLKDAGFHFQPEYFGQRKVWTRRNDFEGRMRLEEIEAAVRGNAAEQEATR
jgi:hypothetical protein